MKRAGHSLAKSKVTRRHTGPPLASAGQVGPRAAIAGSPGAIAAAGARTTSATAIAAIAAPASAAATATGQRRGGAVGAVDDAVLAPGPVSSARAPAPPGRGV